MKRLFIYLFLLFIFGCSSDDTPRPSGSVSGGPTSGTIDPEFEGLLERFYFEMEVRGRNLRLTPISVVFVSQLTAPNSGQYCAYGYANFQNSGAPRVEVLRAFNCWDSRTAIEQENLMFHEFGHALLNRGHYSPVMPNGSPRSLMCTEVCSNYRVYHDFQQSQRKYYLDELAGIASGTPNWAQQKNYTTTVYSDNFDTSQESWDNGIEYPTTDGSYSFFIEESSSYSAPFALGIEVTNNTNFDSYAYWFKDFEIVEHDPCANFVLTTNIATENFDDGYLGVIMDVMKIDDHGELKRIGRHLDYHSSSTSSEALSLKNFEAIARCVPIEADAIRVRFFLQTELTNAKVYFDDLKIDLYQ